MKIVTFNIRCVYDGKYDGINSFIHRALFIADKIKSEKPDVIGFQEINEKNLAALELVLPDYLFVGQLRGPEYDGEGLYTAIRKETCSLIGLETIWLSPTPHVPASRFECQSEYPRICTATKIRHKESGRIFRVFNIHLDHVSDEARVLGIKAAVSFMNKFDDNAPAILLGDFNAHPESETIRFCNENSKLIDVTKNIKATFHNFFRQGISFDYSESALAKIDYIYMSPELADITSSVNIWDDSKHGIYLSDHYPILAEINF